MSHCSIYRFIRVTKHLIQVAKLFIRVAKHIIQVAKNFNWIAKHIIRVAVSTGSFG
jgi:hypothetical protein